MTGGRLPVYFISHGGGPWPWMKEETQGMYNVLEASLANMPRQIGVTPKAVLVISGHWEEQDFTVMASPRPPMIYDYSGFPAHTYRIHYSAPGSPDLARRVQQLLAGAGITANLDERRGFDHGTYAPLYAIYPNADIPVVQLSMKHDYDPSAHLAAGRALAPLRDEGILIVGSGLSYHNLRAMGPGARRPSGEFDAWLNRTLVESAPRERTAGLLHWSNAPAARHRRIRRKTT